MGTWGEGNYENDDALDWASGIVQAQDLTPVTSALQAVTQVSPGAYLEAPHCSRALAAAEVLAALKGSPSDDIPDDLEAWIAEHRDQDPAPYLAEALAAIHLIRNASELKDLMDEAGVVAAWSQVLDDLHNRLAAKRTEA